MKVEIKGNKMVIEIDTTAPTASASGKTLVIASTHGNQKTGVMVNGKEVVLGLNAYIKNG